MAMTLDEIHELETSWIGRVPSDDPECFGWEPFNIHVFADLIDSCLEYVPAGNRTALDAGCGIGTKCLYMFQAGLEAYGFDRMREFLDEAERLGVPCELADARTFARYGDYGLVYVNHPLACGQGCNDEARLERAIHRQMRTGAVLLDVNYDLAPGCSAHPADSPCTDDCPEDGAAWPEIVRWGRWSAAWVKP